MKRLVFILIAAFISTANIWAQQSQDMPEYDPNSPVTDLGDVILDYNLFKEWPKERVFIIDSLNYGFPVDVWIPEYGAVAIGLQTMHVDVRIALDNISPGKIIWGPNGQIKKAGRSPKNYSNYASSGIECDFDGLNNTTEALKLLNTDEISALKLIRKFEFDDGRPGYIPALGEMVELFKYKDEINHALEVVGGTLIEDDWYWTSSQHYLDYRIWAYGGMCSEGTRWFAQLRNGDTGIARQYGVCAIHCRPFGELGTPGNPIPEPEEVIEEKVLASNNVVVAAEDSEDEEVVEVVDENEWTEDDGGGYEDDEGEETENE